MTRITFIVLAVIGGFIMFPALLKFLFFAALIILALRLAHAIMRPKKGQVDVIPPDRKPRRRD